MFKWGMALLLISVIRAVAFPVIEPANRENPGLWLEVYSYSVMIWVPAVILIVLSAIMPVWLRIVRWVENGR